MITTTSWIIIGIVAAFSIWFQICLRRTVAQRRLIIDDIYEIFRKYAKTVTVEEFSDYVNMSQSFYKVSFDKHLFTNILFSDYRKLYPAIFKDQS